MLCSSCEPITSRSPVCGSRLADPGPVDAGLAEWARDAVGAPWQRHGRAAGCARDLRAAKVHLAAAPVADDGAGAWQRGELPAAAAAVQRLAVVRLDRN